MLWGCIALGGTSVLHKIDGIMRAENDVDILKQHISQEVRVWSQMGLLMDNDPKHTSKVVAK